MSDDVVEVTTAEARNRFSDFINRVSVQKEWVLLTRRGKPIAGAVPLEEFQYFEGPEGNFDTQCLLTFDDIMTREERFRAGQVGEAAATYQVDNKVHHISSTEARNNLSEVLNRVCYGKERIILTRGDWNLFALLPPEVFDKYVEVDQLQIEQDIRSIEQAERDGELGNTMPLEEMLERYGIR